MPFSASASSAGISLDHDPMFPACPDEISALPKTAAKSFIKHPERGQEVIAREGGWDHRSHPQPSSGQRGWGAGRPGWGRGWHAECRKSGDTAQQQAALPGTGTAVQGAAERVSCEPGGEDDGDRGHGGQRAFEPDGRRSPAKATPSQATSPPAESPRASHSLLDHVTSSTGRRHSSRGCPLSLLGSSLATV